MRGYDAWVTREPDYFDWEPPPQPKCSRCGRYVKREALWTVQGEDAVYCDGKTSTYQTTYTERDASLLDIIGWGFLGETYNVEYPPPCGEEREHEAHYEVVNSYTVVYRRCSAGHIAKEFIF